MTRVEGIEEVPVTGQPSQYPPNGTYPSPGPSQYQPANGTYPSPAPSQHQPQNFSQYPAPIGEPWSTGLFDCQQDQTNGKCLIYKFS